MELIRVIILQSVFIPWCLGLGLLFIFVQIIVTSLCTIVPFCVRLAKISPCTFSCYIACTYPLVKGLYDVCYMTRVAGLPGPIRLGVSMASP
jgi:hypothetical protein